MSDEDGGESNKENTDEEGLSSESSESDSSESESSDSVSDSSESEDSDSDQNSSAQKGRAEESRATALNSVRLKTPTASPLEGRTTSDCGIRLKLTLPKSANSNPQPPYLSDSTATNERLDPMTTQPVLPHKFTKRQDKLPSTMPVPSTTSVVASGGTGTEAVPGSTNAVPGTTGASTTVPPQKKAPPSPRTLARLTGLDFKPLPNISIGKKRQASDGNSKPVTKHQRTEDRQRGQSALQRAHSRYVAFHLVGTVLL